MVATKLGQILRRRRDAKEHSSNHDDAAHATSVVIVQLEESWLGSEMEHIHCNTNKKTSDMGKRGPVEAGGGAGSSWWRNQLQLWQPERVHRLEETWAAAAARGVLPDSQQRSCSLPASAYAAAGKEIYTPGLARLRRWTTLPAPPAWRPQPRH